MPTQETHIPASPHTERTILGAMLQDAVALREAVGTLRAEDFSLDSHRRVYSAILALLDRGLDVDLTTVRAELERQSELSTIGGISYLLSLTEDVPRNLAIGSYLRIVKEKSVLRQAMSIHQDYANLAQDPSEDAESILERSMADLRALMEDGIGKPLQPIGTYLDAQGEPEGMFDQMAITNGVKLGFPELDAMTHGCQPGQIIVIAGRPSSGKTAVVCNAIYHASYREGKTVAFFSLEHDKHSIVRRILSAQARIDHDAISRGALRSADRQLLLEYREMLRQAPLYIDDSPRMTATNIRAKAAQLKRQVGLDLIVVDQLSKVKGADVYVKGMQAHQVIGAQMDAFGVTAKELGVPVILLNQLKRESEKRKDGTPQLSDLKESGDIEEDADGVVLVHRPEMYDRTDETLKGKGQLILAKNRNGATGTVHCAYEARILRWTNDWTPPAQQTSMDDRYEGRF